MRGDGRIFSQPGSRFLYISYYCRGKEHRESSKSADPKVAEKLLRLRLKEVGGDQIGARRFLGPAVERLRMKELLDAVETDKRNRGRRIPSEMPYLHERWDEYRAMEIDGAVLAKWESEMLAKKLRPSTINKYQQIVAQAFQLAKAQDRLAYTPFVRKMPVGDNSRTQIYTPEEQRRLIALLPDYLKDFTRWAFATGWRAGSIQSLRWEDVKGGELTLRSQYAKNRTAQTVPLVGPLAAIIEGAGKRKKGEYVFHYEDGGQIGSYKTAFNNAKRKAGIVGKRFHDTRATAATELRRAGVPEEVAMRITGHKTRSMFLRYRIEDRSEMKEAILQRERYQREVLAGMEAVTAALQ
jgi:integrase